LRAVSCLARSIIAGATPPPAISSHIPLRATNGISLPACAQRIPPGRLSASPPLIRSLQRSLHMGGLCALTARRLRAAFLTRRTKEGHAVAQDYLLPQPSRWARSPSNPSPARHTVPPYLPPIAVWIVAWHGGLRCLERRSYATLRERGCLPGSFFFLPRPSRWAGWTRRILIHYLSIPTAAFVRIPMDGAFNHRSP